VWAVQQHEKWMAALHHRPRRGWKGTSDEEAALTEVGNGGTPSVFAIDRTSAF